MPKDNEIVQRKYRRNKKRRKTNALNGRTRRDPFENVAIEIEEQFEQNQKITAKQLLKHLQNEHPGEFSELQQRTLRRRLEQLRYSGAEPCLPPPARESYPKHICSRNKLTAQQWQPVNKEILKHFDQNQNVKAVALIKILQNEFPQLVTEAQLPTIRRRLSKLRNQKTRIPNERNAINSSQRPLA